MFKALSSPFVRSLGFLLGASMGAGMFGLPTIFSQSGFVWGTLLYAALVVITLCVHLAYAHLQANAGHSKDFAGVIRQSLGVWGWRVAVVIYPVSIYGSVLIYLLLGSQFLSALSGMLGGPTDRQFWQMVLWLIFAWGSHSGMKGVARLERPIAYVLLSALLLMTGLAAVTGKGIPWTSELVPSTFSIGSFIGVVFFVSLSLPVVAEVMAFNARRPAMGRRTVFFGTILVAVLKWLFAITFAGVAIGGTVEVMDLMRALPKGVQWLLPFVGLLSISGAAITVLHSLRTVYADEYKIRPLFAWVLAIFPPLAIALASTQSVLTVMTVLGSVVTATVAFLVCLSALVLRRRIVGRFPRMALYLAAGLCLFTLAHTFIL